MKRIKVPIELCNSGKSKFSFPIPDGIAELMDWNLGDLVEVPFHNFIKVSVESAVPKLKVAMVVDKVTVKLGQYEKDVTREDVIKILENPPDGIENYRTAFIIYDGKRFGVKNICKEIFVGLNEDFNTIQGERYLNKLGFETYRKK